LKLGPWACSTQLPLFLFHQVKTSGKLSMHAIWRKGVYRNSWHTFYLKFHYSLKSLIGLLQQSYTHWRLFIPFIYQHTLSLADFQLEEGKVTLKRNLDEALSEEYLEKSNGDEALNDDFLQKSNSA
jgi:hypothetical protein